MEHKIYGEVQLGQYSKTGQLLKIWDSLKEASDAIGVSVQLISHCCNGRCKTAGGYCWSFI